MRAPRFPQTCDIRRWRYDEYGDRVGDDDVLVVHEQACSVYTTRQARVRQDENTFAAVTEYGARFPHGAPVQFGDRLVNIRRKAPMPLAQTLEVIAVIDRTTHIDCEVRAI